MSSGSISIQSGESLDQTARREKVASRSYLWLLLSPLITFPLLAIFAWDSDFHDLSGPIVRSALPHLILLLGLSSSRLFVKRHTQQALLLAGLRTASGWFFVGVQGGDAICTWTVVNGALWLGGAIWGLRQVQRGQCSLMSRRPAEFHLVPRPWARGAASGSKASETEWRDRPYQVAKPGRSQMRQARESSTATTPSVDILQKIVSPEKALIHGKSLQGDRPEEAVRYLLFAFQRGSLWTRQRAEAALQALGEVELF